MKNSQFPRAALPAEIARHPPLPPAGDAWLHEIKHDGHRLVAIVARGSVKRCKAATIATALEAFHLLVLARAAACEARR